MKRLGAVLGLIVGVVGIGLSGWAPLVFEELSGRTLPAPVPTDVTAMTIWSGVAFVRAFGAVLFGFGAVLWAVGTHKGTRGVIKAVCYSSAFAAVIVLTQQVAIWANAVGFALVGLFCVIALISGIDLLREGRPNASSAT